MNYTYVFISNRFISSNHSDGKLLSNFQDSSFFHYATIETIVLTKFSFFFAINVKKFVKPTIQQNSAV